MLHVYEFELFEDEGKITAIPFDMDGGTCGKDFKDACEMAAAWLQTEMEHRAMHNLHFPEATFGNEPKEGGKVVIVAVNAGKDTVPKVTAAEAARMLGVTPGRVSQMVASEQLETFEEGGRRWVSKHSVDARLAEKPKAGRPKLKA